MCLSGIQHTFSSTLPIPSLAISYARARQPCHTHCSVGQVCCTCITTSLHFSQIPEMMKSLHFWLALQSVIIGRPSPLLLLALAHPADPLWPDLTHFGYPCCCHTGAKCVHAHTRMPMARVSWFQAEGRAYQTHSWRGLARGQHTTLCNQRRHSIHVPVEPPS